MIPDKKGIASSAWRMKITCFTPPRNDISNSSRFGGLLVVVGVRR